MDNLFRIEMLGRLEVRLGSREISRFRTQKTAALLAYLAFYRQRSHPRDVLTELFWPESALEAARSNLSVALNSLRRQLEVPGTSPGAILIADRLQVRLNPLAFTTDVEEFDRITSQVETEDEADTRCTLQREALVLYRGDLLPGFYEDWILTERDRLRDTYLHALKQIVERYVQTREYDRAIEYSHRIVQADPLHEAAYYNLMRLYVAVGRPEEALHQYHALKENLHKELQTGPSEPLCNLAEKLQQSGPSRRQPLNIRPIETRTGGSGATTSQARPNVQRPVSNLPFQFTRFFGQELLIQRLKELLTASPEQSYPPARLITLTGPGGTGKTRISIEVARQMPEAFPGGIWITALAELYDPLRLGEALRDLLELPRQSHVSALDQVIACLNALREPVLLILDNFEQIVAGGAPTVWTLLNRVDTLSCLITSRQPLSLPGEWEIPVLPLSTPTIAPASSPQSLSATHLLTYPGIALFVDRAQAKRPEFQITPRNAEAIAGICSELEGIPLAIELAAARARALTPHQILERLSERFELLASRSTDKSDRHRSLWATIEWSYHLLPPGLQRLLARLSVFRGGWSLEAAEAVCQEPMTLDYLSQLRGHSLVSTDDSVSSMRFRMLETIREFAREICGPLEYEGAERRHADHFHQWVMGAKMVGAEKAVWLERFETDFDNLRAVLSWSLGVGGDLEIGLQTAGALSHFWQMRGYFSEGRRWYDALLDRVEDSCSPGVGKSLYGAGMLAARQGDFSAAVALLERCLEVEKTLDDPGEMAFAINELGGIAFSQGNYELARRHYGNCLEMARSLGRPDRLANSLNNLANVELTAGDFAASQALYEQSVALWREVGDRFGEAMALHNLANLARSQKQLEEAQSYYIRSLAIKRDLGDPYSISLTLRGIAEVAKDQGDYPICALYLRESLALARELSARMHLVNILNLMISLVRALGDLETAAQMYGALERIRQEIDSPLDSKDQQSYDRGQQELRDSLGTSRYDASHTEGGKLTLEQALVALEETLAARSL